MEGIKERLITIGDNADASDVVFLYNGIFDIFGNNAFLWLTV